VSDVQPAVAGMRLDVNRRERPSAPTEVSEARP